MLTGRLAEGSQYSSAIVLDVGKLEAELGKISLTDLESRQTPLTEAERAQGFINPYAVDSLVRSIQKQLIPAISDPTLGKAIRDSAMLANSLANAVLGHNEAFQSLARSAVNLQNAGQMSNAEHNFMLASARNFLIVVKHYMSLFPTQE